MLKYIFFDLDGTLTDSSVGIIKAVKYALLNFDIEINDTQFLRRYIGPPLMDCFKEFNGLSEEESILALKYYRDYYNVTGKFENKPYEGVVEMLAMLNEKGLRCVIATSKPEDVMGDVLNHFDLYKYFYSACGATLDSKRNKKSAVIKYALEKLSINPKECIMVGDHKHDIGGAHENGMKAIAVTYGYGERRELTQQNPEYIVNSVKELKDILLTLI